MGEGVLWNAYAVNAVNRKRNCLADTENCEANGVSDF